MALRTRLDRSLRIDGLRLAPRRYARVALVLSRGSRCQFHRPDPLHDPAGFELPLDAPLLPAGPTGRGFGRSDPIGGHRGCADGQLVVGRSDRFLVSGSLCYMAGIRCVS